MREQSKLWRDNGPTDAMQRAQHWVSLAVLPGGWVMLMHWMPGKPEPSRHDVPADVLRDVRACLEGMRDEDARAGRSTNNIGDTAAAEDPCGRENIFALRPPEDPLLCTCPSCTFMPH